MVVAFEITTEIVLINKYDKYDSIVISGSSTSSLCQGRRNKKAI